MSEWLASRWRISGRVQGVGFRWSVVQLARKLDLAGWTTNLPDGTVEVVACGLPSALEALERFLATGPRGAHVEDVEKVHIPHENVEGKPFEIR